MAPRAPHGKLPVAPRRKRVMHALYLAQPLLQFAALMAVLFILGRCSPLAPSVSEEKLMATQSAAAQASGGHDDAAQDADIKRELKDIASSDELPLLSQSDFVDKVLANSLQADKTTNLADVQNLFHQRDLEAGAQRDVRILVLQLSAEQKDTFFRSGSLRINLVDALSASMAANVRQDFFTEIHKLVLRSDLTAKSYLVLADEDMAAPDAVSAVPVATKFQIAIFPNDQSAWVQLTRLDQKLDDQQQKLIESAKAKALSMELVLE